MRDPEQPGGEGTRVVERLELATRLEQRVLHDVLAVEDRSGHPRTVAVKARPKMGHRFQKGDITRVESAPSVEVGSVHTDQYAADAIEDTDRRRVLLTARRGS